MSTFKIILIDNAYTTIEKNLGLGNENLIKKIIDKILQNQKQ